MTCGGCSGAINRVLTKNIQQRESKSAFKDAHTDISSANGFDVSLEKQRVLIWGPSLPSFDEVTEKIKKTGKEIREKKVVEDKEDLPVLDA